ncbi:hypothetical protein PINS_up018861 [Pythium insidiosum]|nr:hypothetical protein PINS_up018861 [Pythium insidiosum]
MVRRAVDDLNGNGVDEESYHPSVAQRRRDGFKREYDDAVEEDFDREFYLNDDAGGVETHAEHVFLGNEAKFASSKSDSRGRAPRVRCGSKECRRVRRRCTPTRKRGRRTDC